jgi:hypothetical protein
VSKLKPIDLGQPAEPPSFEHLRELIAVFEQDLANAKHQTWEAMRRIRDGAREAEAAEMRKLRDLAEPLERQVEAMKAAIAEHHADRAVVIFVPKAEPAMMIF